MYSTLDAERMAAAFLASEPDYDEPAWVDAYAKALGVNKSEMSAAECSMAARTAYVRQGEFNPKIAAMLDADLGPTESPQ